MASLKVRFSYVLALFDLQYLIKHVPSTSVPFTQLMQIMFLFYLQSQLFTNILLYTYILKYIYFLLFVQYLFHSALLLINFEELIYFVIICGCKDEDNLYIMYTFSKGCLYALCLKTKNIQYFFNNLCFTSLRTPALTETVRTYNIIYNNCNCYSMS